MAKKDISLWTFTGVIIGMISSAFVNSGNSSMTIIGAVAGGLIGYMLARVLR